MALELPEWVVTVFNLIGLPWPGVDEDQLRDWAASVRRFSGEIVDNSSGVNRAMRELAGSSQSSVISAVADEWERRHRLLVELRGPMDDFAGALDVAAEAVVAQKEIVIGAAVALAAEFTGTQIGAVFTFGADELAVAPELALTREAVKKALETLTGSLLGTLLQMAGQDLLDSLNRTIGNFLTASFEVGTEARSLTIMYDAVRDAASQIRGYAAKAEEIGSRAHGETSGRDLTDSSGGGGWNAIIGALREGLEDFARELFQKLTGVIAHDLGSAAGILTRLTDDAEEADRDGEPGVPQTGPAARAPGTEAGTADDTREGGGTPRDTPRDPVTGNPLEAGDGEFLGYHPRALDWFRNGEAPLGMTPETYREWAASLRDALRADGIAPEDVDVRLLGSGGRGFSGPHKPLPSDEEITASYPPDTAETAIRRKAEWLGDDQERLRGRPFDAMSRLGLDEPSDYDTNISSDAMVAKAREQWEADGQPGSFLSGDHEYVSKPIAEKRFPNVTRWADTWAGRLGRDVSWAIFPGTGPKDTSATSGHYVHFQDSDWIVFRPEDH